jgi:4'-phosphopantetheinyl transferase
MPGDAATGPARVDVWLVRTTPFVEPTAAQWASLSEAESARAKRYLFARDRTHYVLAHAWLRRILADFTGLAPEALAIVQDGQDKPTLQASMPMRRPAFFNLSHTEGLVAIAVSPDCEVGVDVEPIRPWPEVASFAHSVLHPHESGVLQRLPAADQGRYFFGVWCAKEAYTKATGQGLAHPFASFATPFAAVPVDWHETVPLTAPGLSSASLRVATDRGSHAVAVAALAPSLDAILHIV